MTRIIYKICLVASILTLSLTFKAFSQKQERSYYQKVKHLLQVLETSKDTQRVQVLTNLCQLYCKTNPPKAREYGERALHLSKVIGYSEGTRRALNQLGRLYSQEGRYHEAIDRYRQKLRLAQKLDEPIEFAVSLNDLGTTYQAQHKYQQAIKYYEKSYEVATKIGKPLHIANPMHNLATLYKAQKEYRLSERYYLQALGFYMEEKQATGTLLTLKNLGDLAEVEQQPTRAEQYYQRALDIARDLGEDKYIAQCLNALAGLYFMENLEAEKAIKFAEEAYKVSDLQELSEEHKKACQILARINARQNNFDAAYQYQSEYSRLNEQHYLRENAKHLSEMQGLFEAEKQRNKMELMRKEQKIQKEELLIKRLFMNYFWFAIGFIVVAFALMYRGNRIRTKANRALKTQYREIQEQQEELISKNEKIAAQHASNQALLQELKENNIRLTDSIRYAERIQLSILPHVNQLKDNFADHFVIFKPKDVVSGDFYWFNQVGDMRFVAVVDCTGHGVPGAFMSMIGNTLLSEIVSQEHIYEPYLILEHLHDRVRQSLKQQDSSNTDGMDIALCRMETLEDGKTKVVFSGAKSEIRYWQDETLETLRGERKSIGGWQRETKRTFSQQEVILEKDSLIYFATDGYTDTANSKRRKLGRKKYEAILKANAHKELKLQGVALLEYLYEYKGQTEQRDDITLMGLKL